MELDSSWYLVLTWLRVHFRKMPESKGLSRLELSRGLSMSNDRECALPMVRAYNSERTCARMGRRHKRHRARVVPAQHSCSRRPQRPLQPGRPRERVASARGPESRSALACFDLTFSSILSLTSGRSVEHFKSESFVEHFMIVFEFQEVRDNHREVLSSKLFCRSIK